MKIKVVGYNTLKDVTTSLGGVTHLYYVQLSGTVTKILALCSSNYVEATSINVAATSLLSDFPSAIETPVDVSGEF